jgi:hydroxymethylpyrimidine/phosphomethylpyrimidine kinase
MSAPAVLSIGTTHPWNTAGVGLDLLLARELGVRVFTVVTAVSAQDEGGIHALETIDAATIRAQLAAISMTELRAVRAGALTSAENVHLIADYVRRAALPAVVDPVAAATRGGSFADDATMNAIRTQLATLPNVILTPNLAEAARLLGTAPAARESLADTARTLQRLGARAVLLKGGHLSGDPADALATAGGIEIFRESRLPGEMRGTGCTLAIAIASRLAHGADLRDAVVAARAFVRERIGENARGS